MDKHLQESGGGPSEEQIDQFQNDGYISFHHIFSTQTVHAINHRLECVLRGEYDTGLKPDKTPKPLKTPLPLNQLETRPRPSPRYHGSNHSATETVIATAAAVPTNNHDWNRYALGYSGNKRKKVFQVINIHKADTLFLELVTCPLLGKLVSKLMKWEHGARLAQDQIWAK
jgi:hypothetical protein